MRYRRLGSTGWMISEVGLDARALLQSDAETAAATIRAAIALGITAMAWSVSDATEDIEPLIAKAAGSDRGRLTLIALLDHVPSAEAVGPQVEAISSRLGSAVDIVAFPGALGDAERAAFEEARGRGSVRLAATTEDDTVRIEDARVTFAETPAAARDALDVGQATCVLVPVATPGDLRALVAR